MIASEVWGTKGGTLNTTLADEDKRRKSTARRVAKIGVVERDVIREGPVMVREEECVGAQGKFKEPRGMRIWHCEERFTRVKDHTGVLVPAVTESVNRPESAKRCLILVRCKENQTYLPQR